MPLDLKRAYDPAYLNHFFDRNDLVDKASTIGRIEHGAVLCNFYRMRDSGRYSPDDRRRLERVLPLVTALISAHYQIVGGQRTRSLVHTIVGKRQPPFDRLTPREREVCERILLGYTSIGIGLDLHIALSSVLTYRKRAYAKLDISSQNQLFALCLRPHS
jgi:DNA-binding CsgD family transcriptional regulator